MENFIFCAVKLKKMLPMIGLILFVSNKAIEDLSPSYVSASTNSVVTR